MSLFKLWFELLLIMMPCYFLLFWSMPFSLTIWQSWLQIGGTPAVIHYLLEKGLLDGDCMTGMWGNLSSWLSFSWFSNNIYIFVTVTGKTLAENAKHFLSLSEGQVRWWICYKLSFYFLPINQNTFAWSVPANNTTTWEPHQINRTHSDTLWKSCSRGFCSKNNWQRRVIFLWYSI